MEKRVVVTHIVNAGEFYAVQANDMVQLNQFDDFQFDQLQSYIITKLTRAPGELL